MNQLRYGKYFVHRNSHLTNRCYKISINSCDTIHPSLVRSIMLPAALGVQLPVKSCLDWLHKKSCDISIAVLPTPRSNREIGLLLTLFWPRKTAKNGCAAVWRNISYTYLYRLLSGASVWKVNAPRFGEISVGNTVWYRHLATIIAQVMFASFEMPNSLDKLPNSPAWYRQISLSALPALFVWLMTIGTFITTDAQCLGDVS